MHFYIILYISYIYIYIYHIYCIYTYIYIYYILYIYVTYILYIIYIYIYIYISIYHILQGAWGGLGPPGESRGPGSLGCPGCPGVPGAREGAGALGELREPGVLEAEVDRTRCISPLFLPNQMFGQLLWLASNVVMCPAFAVNR